MARPGTAPAATDVGLGANFRGIPGGRISDVISSVQNRLEMLQQMRRDQCRVDDDIAPTGGSHAAVSHTPSFERAVLRELRELRKMVARFSDDPSIAARGSSGRSATDFEAEAEGVPVDDPSASTAQKSQQLAEEEARLQRWEQDLVSALSTPIRRR